MKSIIIYFSQTGNTEKIAKAIQAGIKQIAGHCDILKIKDANPKKLYEYDLIGVGSPVHGPLGCTGTFLDDMKFVGGKHAFIFCTHGTMPGKFFPSVYEKMNRKGLKVIGCGDWYGDCYLLHEPEPYWTTGHPDEIDLNEAEAFGRELVQKSWRISAGETDLILPEPQETALPPLPSSQGNAPPFDIIGLEKVLHSFPTKLKYHKEKCLFPQCRICMDNCPLDGIDLSVDPLILAKPCINCEFCARVCPTGALDMDEWMKLYYL
jgi:flavodoxin/NAD-dependent dihydropyrimidine dehydrogenase PreA subunit